MPLLGQHSQNPAGSPQVMAALAQLAQKGDPQSLATLQTIASGGTTHGSSLPGWNQDITWNPSDQGRTQEMQYAKDELTGNTGELGSLASAAQAQHKDWTGGTLAGLAPLAAAFIPGIGPLAAAGIGAAAGGLESAGGATNNSFLGGAAQGAALGGGGKLAMNKLFPGTPAAPAGAGLPGAPIGDAGLGGMGDTGGVSGAYGGAAGGTAGGTAGAAANSGGGFLSSLGGVAKNALVGGQGSNGLLGSNGNLDWNKALGLGLGALNTVGNVQRNNAANTFNQSQIDTRNALLSRILQQPTYNFQPDAPKPTPMAGQPPVSGYRPPGS